MVLPGSVMLGYLLGGKRPRVKRQPQHVAAPGFLSRGAVSDEHPTGKNVGREKERRKGSLENPIEIEHGALGPRGHSEKARLTLLACAIEIQPGARSVAVLKLLDHQIGQRLGDDEPLGPGSPGALIERKNWAEGSIVGLSAHPQFQAERSRA